MQSTRYRSVKIDGVSVFYREAGRKDAPTILLLHGLPSSSRMFVSLFDRLSDRYRLVAPDSRVLGTATGRIETIRVYIRSHCRTHDSFCRGNRTL